MAMLLHAINQAALVKSTDFYNLMPSSAAAFRFLGAYVQGWTVLEQCRSNCLQGCR